jgi:hypothetical protein
MSLRPLLLLAALATVAACGGNTPPITPAPPPPISGIGGGAPMPPDGPTDIGSIRRDPALLGAWADYCTDIKDTAFIMIYPPPPEAVRIQADLEKCEAIFAD